MKDLYDTGDHHCQMSFEDQNSQKLPKTHHWQRMAIKKVMFKHFHWLIFCQPCYKSKMGIHIKKCQYYVKHFKGPTYILHRGNWKLDIVLLFLLICSVSVLCCGVLGSIEG